MKKTLILFIFIFIFISDVKSNSEIKVKSDYIIAYAKYKWINWDIYKWVDCYSREYKIHPLFVCAVIQQESNGKKYIRGKDGEYGYMQVLPIHFKGKNIPEKLRFEPEYNIKIGCWYLSGALKRSKTGLKGGLRRYNQGWYGKAKKYKNWKYVYQIIRDYKDSLNCKNMRYI